MVAILAGTAIMQIKYLNRALQRFDATQVIPVQFVLFTLSVIGGSAILYRDFERTSAEDAGKFVGGCALTFFGVWLITTGRPPRNDGEEEDREPEPEDAINLIGERYRDDVDESNSGSAARTSSPPINIHSRYRDDPDSPSSSPTARVRTEPLPRKLQGTSPSNSDLPNPWASATPDSSPLPPRFPRHTSTPILPSEAALPHIASTSNPELATPNLPSTPTRGISHDELSSTPTLTPTIAQARLRQHARQADRLSRPSLSGPLLTSPLSTTLSAMVQDIKRGGGTIRQRDIDALSRRRESLLADGNETSTGSSSTGAGTGLLGEPLTRARTQGDPSTAAGDEGADAVIGRGRSLSGTLGDLWRGWRGESGDGAGSGLSGGADSGGGGRDGGEQGGGGNTESL